MYFGGLVTDAVGVEDRAGVLRSGVSASALERSCTVGTRKVDSSRERVSGVPLESATRMRRGGA